MGIFEQFPYANFHEINIDWILRALKKYGEKLDAYDEYIKKVVAEAVNDDHLTELILTALTQYGLVINVKAPPDSLSPASGDGSTDDTSAVQACIDYATNKGYGVVFFPAGDYSISALTMSERVALVGANRYTSKIVQRGGAIKPLIGAVSNSGIYNITLSANSGAQTEQPHIITYCNNAEFSSLIFTDCYSPILASVEGHCQFTEIVFHNIGRTAFDVTGNHVTMSGIYIDTLLDGVNLFTLFGNFNHLSGVVAVDNSIFTVTGHNNYISGSFPFDGNISGDFNVYRNTGVTTNDQTQHTKFSGEKLDIQTSEPIGYKAPTVLNEYFNTVPATDAEGNPYNILVEGEHLANLKKQELHGLHSHFRVWVKALSQAESEEGVTNWGTGTKEDPYRSLDLAFKETLDAGHTELRFYLMAAGRYTVGEKYPLSNFAGISCHIDALSAGCVVDFVSDESTTPPEFSFYLGHWNLSGLDNGPLTIMFNGGTGDYYFDNCLVTLKNTTFIGRFRMYGGQLICGSGTGVCEFEKFYANNAIVSFTDQTIFRDMGTGTTVDLINCRGRMQGGKTVYNPSQGNKTFLHLATSILYLGSRLNLADNAPNYAKGIMAENGSLLLARPTHADYIYHGGSNEFKYSLWANLDTGAIATSI